MRSGKSFPGFASKVTWRGQIGQQIARFLHQQGQGFHPCFQGGQPDGLKPRLCNGLRNSPRPSGFLGMGTDRAPKL